MWQRFTERARKVVFFAQEEAGRLGENYVSTEHLLLGLVRENDSVAARILDRMGVSLGRIRSEVERQVAHGEGRLGQDMQLTPRAKRVIDLAYDEARQLNNNYIGTEHLLLGLIREEDGVAGRVLSKLAVSLDRTRIEVMHLQEGGNENGVRQGSTQPAAPPVVANSNINRYVANALFEARERGYEQPASEHYLLALFTSEDGQATKVLAALGLTRERVLAEIERLEKEANS